MAQLQLFSRVRPAKLIHKAAAPYICRAALPRAPRVLCAARLSSHQAQAGELKAPTGCALCAAATMATAAVPQLFQGVDKASFGYKLLANLGWKEGEGLGAQRQGITEHVKVKKKYDAYGVGAVEHASKVRDWTTGLVGYDTILSNLKEISNKPAKAVASSSSSSSSDDDSSSDEEAAPAHPSMSSKKRKRAGSSSAAKKRKQRSSSSSSSSLEGATSGSDSDDDKQAGPGPSSSAAAAAAEAARVKAATHLGRYSKRERAKAVSNYSATDLAAILGGTWSAPPEIKAANARGGSTTTTSSSSSDDDDDRGANSSSSSSDEEEERGGGDSARALQPSTPPPCESSPAAAAGGSAKAAPLSPQQQQEEEGEVEEVGPPRWWSNMFQRAAAGSGVGAGSSGRQRIQVAGFSEQDQTNLYMQVHDAKTSGRVGLGRSSMPKKVAGARWQGKKTILAESDAEEEEQPQEEQQQQEEGVQDAGMPVDTNKYVVTVKNGITIVMPRSKLGQAPADTKEDTQQQQKQQQQEGQQKSKGKKRKQQQQQVKAAKAGAGGSASQGAAANAQKSAPSTPAAAGGSKGKGKTKGDKKVKWGKLAQRILANAPKRRMKLAKLRQQVLEAAGLAAAAAAAANGGGGGSGEGSGEVGEQQMVKKLRKSSSFVVGEKYVALADAA